MFLCNSFYVRIIVTIVFFILVLFCLPNVCGHNHDHHGHSHDHDGSVHEEPASFKWSKEANDAYKHAEKDNINHGFDGKAEAKTEQKPHSHRPTGNDGNLWAEALGATLAISIAPYLILFIIPLNNSKEHESYLKILLAFASGGLLGDAFLHLIPHALMAQASKENSIHAHSHSHSHSHNHFTEETDSHSHDTTIGTSVLGGIIVFLIVEKFVRIFKGGHSHSHLHKSEEQEELRKNDNKQENGNTQNKSSEEMQITIKGNMKVAGYLNLAADFTHNFTDGLAIGASFLAGRSVGLVTTFTIFLHEIPHEIGDFAILLQSGCSKRKAMMLQLITAVGALTGTWVSLMAEGSDSAVSWILPFTAGGFIYIATVSVIPELLENSHFWQSIAEVAALMLGVSLMMVITWVEEMGHV